MCQLHTTASVIICLLLAFQSPSLRKPWSRPSFSSVAVRTAFTVISSTGRLFTTSRKARSIAKSPGTASERFESDDMMNVVISRYGHASRNPSYNLPKIGASTGEAAGMIDWGDRDPSKTRNRQLDVMLSQTKCFTVSCSCCSLQDGKTRMARHNHRVSQ